MKRAINTSKSSACNSSYLTAINSNSSILQSSLCYIVKCTQIEQLFTKTYYQCPGSNSVSSDLSRINDIFPSITASLCTPQTAVHKRDGLSPGAADADLVLWSACRPVRHLGARRVGPRGRSAGTVPGDGADSGGAGGRVVVRRSSGGPLAATSDPGLPPPRPAGARAQLDQERTAAGHL